MKRAFFIITFFLLCGKAFCQSFTIDEISTIATSQEQDNKSLLMLKGFALCNDCLGEGSLYGYKRNKGMPDEETVVFYPKSFDYMSNSLKFINTLMDQAKAKYKLVKTSQQDDPADDSKSLKSYWYENGNVIMSFVIFKSFGFISIGPK